MVYMCISDLRVAKLMMEQMNEYCSEKVQPDPTYTPQMGQILCVKFSGK